MTTRRLYLDDSYLREFDAEVVACDDDGWCRLHATAFHPGGGGQPCDRGQLVAGGRTLAVAAVREDDAGIVWHEVGAGARDALAAGAAVRGLVDWTQRYAVMRHHSLLHVVNTIALNDFGALITGAQIGAERSRIDLTLADFARDRLADFEARVTDVLARDLVLTASTISEDEYRRRPELIRTLNVRRPSSTAACASSRSPASTRRRAAARTSTRRARSGARG